MRFYKMRARTCDNIQAAVADEHALHLGSHNGSLIEALQCAVANCIVGVARVLGHPFESFVIPFFSPDVRTLKAGRRNMP